MDRLAQASIEQEVGARLTERYWRWISWPVIWSEIQLWSQAYRYRYGSDTDGLKQITDMYHAVAANWALGFGILRVDGKAVSAIPVHVQPDGSFWARGKRWSA